MKNIAKSDIVVPLTVPSQSRDTYIQNYNKATLSTGRLFLFAADQKIEHLNKDFVGSDLSPEVAGPKHLFEIASKARIGAFATHLGLIARYAHDYRSVNYVVKLNAKTYLVPPSQRDPLSLAIDTVQDVVEFGKRNGLSIVGVGYTLYLGSEYEAQMMVQAAQMIRQAHEHGLLATIWCYPRGKAIKEERHPDIIAGAAGVAVALGADFVKVNEPETPHWLEGKGFLKQVTVAAGNTGVICSGGQIRNAEIFLEDLHDQINDGGMRGAAIGRNIFQKDIKQAVTFCDAIAAIIFDDASIDQAKTMLR